MVKIFIKLFKNIETSFYLKFYFQLAKSQLTIVTLFLTIISSQYVVASDLVAHWPLNEGNGTAASDISGQGHDGVLVNNPTWNDSELVFNGIDNHVNVGKLDVIGTALTLTGWVQADQLENCDARDCRILSKASGTATQDHYWMLSTIKVGTVTRLRFRLKTNGFTNTLVASSGNLINGELFHVAALYDGVAMRLYKNGVEIGSLATTGNIDSNNTVEAWIGGNPSVASSRPWEGSIADVRIYQKVLTESEVNDIKNGYEVSDTIPPVINNIQVVVTDTTATFTWDTDELSDSTVEYGLNNSDETITNDPSHTTTHSITLTGLTANTKYHYLLSSSDTSGNSASDVDSTFTTVIDSGITAPLISNIQVEVTNSTATIDWETDELSNSVVNYGQDSGYGSIAIDSVQSITHRLILTGLSSNTDYHYQVKSADSQNNTGTSEDSIFTTDTFSDNTPPVINNIQATVTDTTAIITWNTDEIADSEISYGNSITYENGTVNDVAQITSHSITLTGLVAETTYHYQVSSKDGSENSTLSNDLTFKTTNGTSDDLIAYWPLNEGNGSMASDITGNGNDGTLTNNPIWTGNNLVFDGDDDYVNLGNLDVSGTALTLSGWVQANQLENCAARDCRILSKASGTSTQDHYWMLGTIKVGAVTRLRFRLKTNGSTSTLIASAGDLTNGEQFHVAAVYDGVTMRLYKDGIQVGSLAKTGSLDTNNTVEAWIGGNPTIASSRPWEGSIADVRIHQKALTETEVNIVKNSYDTSDTVPPIISNIQVSVTDITAIINWDTNEASDSTVDYGLDNSHGTTTNDSALTTTHSLILTGLTTNTEYHFLVSSSDVNENRKSDVDRIFTTASSPDIIEPLISNIQITVTDITATITWNTDEPADGEVSYGSSSTYENGTVFDEALRSSHSMTLTGLTAETTYHFQVGSKDDSANSALSNDLIFTTAATTTETGDNLIAHWPLNEDNGSTANDITGNGNDGVLIHDPIWNGSELTFDGEDDYVNLGSLDVPGAAMTLTGWVQANQLENCAARDCRILSKASGTSTQDHYWMLGTTKVGTATRLRFRLKTNSFTSTLVASTGDLINGEQFHAAAVYDGSTMRLYKDGIQVGSLEKTGNINTNNTVEAWIAGNPPVASSRPWQGSIANVRIYQKALTETEVNAVKDSDKVIDNISPLISNINVSTTDSTATITWNTSELADSGLTYGLSSAYENGTINGDGSLVLSHSITLTGLTQDSSYHYQINSTDINSNISTSVDLSFNTLLSGGGSDLLIYDLNGIVTKGTHGFPRDEPPLSLANGDWTTPVNYAEGTLYVRAEIRNQPVSQSMQMQLCAWQYNLTLENCAPRKSVQGTPGNIVTWQGKVTSMYKKNGIPIDWENPRQRYGIAIKNSMGIPISDYKDWNWGDLNPDDVYPLDIRFTVVVVPKGQTFSGWDNFID